MSDILQQAIALIKSGDKAGGKRLLGEALREDPRSETAWLWMSGVVETDPQRKDCLERILAINPNNPQAQMGLAKLAAASQPEPEPPTFTPRRPTFEPPQDEAPSFELPSLDPSGFDAFSSEPAPIFPADLGAGLDGSSDSAFASFLSGSQESGSWQDMLPTEKSSVEEFDFFDAQGVEKAGEPASHAAPFDDASLADFFSTGLGDLGAFDDKPAAEESPFGSFGDQTGSAFSFDEPAETDAGPGDFLSKLSGAGDYEPEPLPDTLGETPGFFQETAQAGGFGGAFTEDAFSGDSAGAFLADDGMNGQGALDFEGQADQAAALASEIARQAPVTAPPPVSTSDQRVWVDPRSSANRLTVVSVDGYVVVQPG